MNEYSASCLAEVDSTVQDVSATSEGFRSGEMRSKTDPTQLPISVSVVLTSHNRERYIGQAIRSVQDQNFSGTVEIIVADDMSVDRTPEVVESLGREDHRIILLRSGKRLGVSRNFARAIARASGTYIATLDDDDFWIDSHKLQRQFDCLEANPAVAGVYESVIFVDDAGNRLHEHVVGQAGDLLNRSDFVAAYPLTTQTVMLRRIACPAFPEWGFATAMQDWVFAWKGSELGPFMCSGGISAAYRQSTQSLWAAQSPLKKLEAYFNMVRLLNEHGALEVDPTARQQQSDHAYRRFRHYIDNKFDVVEALKIAWLISRRSEIRPSASFASNSVWVLRTAATRLRRVVMGAIPRKR